jgi:hypothetical protein
VLYTDVHHPSFPLAGLSPNRSTDPLNTMVTVNDTTPRSPCLPQHQGASMFNTVEHQRHAFQGRFHGNMPRGRSALGHLILFATSMEECRVCGQRYNYENGRPASVLS